MRLRKRRQMQFGVAIVLMVGFIASLPLLDGNGVAQALCLLGYMASAFAACGAAVWLDNDDWNDQCPKT